MKIEIEISEDEIRDAVSRKVRVAIADQTNQWSIDDFIRKQVKNLWPEIVTKMIKDELGKSEVIRGKIVLTIENKLKAQVNAIMKASKG
jgi:hypothetical protein